MKYIINNFMATKASDNNLELKEVIAGTGVVEFKEIEYNKGFLVFNEATKEIVNIVFDPGVEKWNGYSIVKNDENIAQEKIFNAQKKYNFEKIKARNFFTDFANGIAFHVDFSTATEADKIEVQDYIENLAAIAMGIEAEEMERPAILESY